MQFGRAQMRESKSTTGATSGPGGEVEDTSFEFGAVAA